MSIQDFCQSAFRHQRFRKASHVVQEHPLMQPTENKTFGLTTTDQYSVFENRSASSFESSLSACDKGEAPQNSDKTDEFSMILGDEICQTLDSNNPICKPSGKSLFRQNCAVTGLQWTDKCLGLTDKRAVLSNVDSHIADEVRTTEVSSVSHCAPLCNLPPNRQVANCAGQWNSAFLEQNNSDSKRVHMERDTPASSISQDVKQLNEVTVFVKHVNSTIAAAGHDLTGNDLAI